MSEFDRIISVPSLVGYGTQEIKMTKNGDHRQSQYHEDNKQDKDSGTTNDHDSVELHGENEEIEVSGSNQEELSENSLDPKNGDQIALQEGSHLQLKEFDRPIHRVDISA